MTNEGLRFPNWITAAIGATLILMPWSLPSLTLASEILVVATGALSCTLLLGSVGLLSFGQRLYFGLGAYVFAVLIRDFGMSAIVAAIAALFAGCLLAAILGLLIVRRRGVYFVMLVSRLRILGLTQSR